MRMQTGLICLSMGVVAVCCVYGNELSGTIEDCEFFDQLRNSELLEKGLACCS
jgi:hypothetical protein